MKYNKSPSGFTMLELVITLAILSALTVLAVRSIQQSLFAKTKIQNQLDDVSQVRDVLRLVERDINLSVHYLDQEKIFNDLLKKNSQTPGAPGVNPGAVPGQQPPTDSSIPWDPVAAQNQQMAATQGVNAEPAYERISPVSQFVGEAQKITFDTRNAVGQDLSDVVTVNYSVDSCPKGTNKCLYRQEKQFFDDPLDLTTGKILLLDGITEITFRYLPEGDTDWKENWRVIDKFPAAVEMTLVVERGPADRIRKISLQEIAAIRFTNNAAATAAAAPTGTGGTGTGTAPSAPVTPPVIGH